ncbi:MAG: response regulator [Anaerolinea sp.]|nr:response regulator [Anaerolinea sp.]
MPPLHALIIEDNANNSEVLQLLLQQQGVDSTIVPSTRGVLAALDQLDQVDVIFLDIEFPIGDGFAVLDLLRTLPRLNGTPIVAYSVHISEIDRARAAGFDGFLGKPLQAQLFPGQLRRILGGRPVWEV